MSETELLKLIYSKIPSDDLYKDLVEYTLQQIPELQTLIKDKVFSLTFLDKIDNEKSNLKLFVQGEGIIDIAYYSTSRKVYILKPTLIKMKIDFENK